jgi:hypothetical protein
MPTAERELGILSYRTGTDELAGPVRGRELTGPLAGASLRR